jgi:hypothetical protein
MHRRIEKMLWHHTIPRMTHCTRPFSCSKPASETCSLTTGAAAACLLAGHALRL